MNVQQSDLTDPALVAEVDLARAAAQEEAGDERVGDYVEYHIEDEAAVTHLFEAHKPGYGGWRWAVTITSAGPDTDVTVSEVVLLPGPTALVAPEWIPWQNRVQAGDLGVGDLLPTSPDDPRLVPAYLQSDDPAVEEAAADAGLGRVRVMSRPARLDAADRWLQSEFGPRSDMARGAPAHCGTCGFYLPLAGSLRAAFGTCGNELSPADGHVVHAEYGCGAHSEAEVEQVSPVLVADLIYDDALLDVEPLEVVDTVPSAAPEAEPVEAPAAESTPDVDAPAESAAEAEPTAVEALGIEPAAEPVAPEVPSTEVPASVVGSEAATPEAPEVEATAAAIESVAAVEAPAIESPAAVIDAVLEASAEPEIAPSPDAAAESPVVAEVPVGGSAAELTDGSGSVGGDDAVSSSEAESLAVVEASVEPDVVPSFGVAEVPVGGPAAELIDGSGSVSGDDAVSSSEAESLAAVEAPAESVAADEGVASAEVDPTAAAVEAVAAVEAPGAVGESPVDDVAEIELVVELEPVEDEPVADQPEVPTAAEAPAAIEPVVTAETGDESTRRE